MNKKHIITIGGKPGSGKSTTSKAIAAHLGYEHFSSGDLFRAINRERGIELFQANLAAEKEKEIDHLVDNRIKEIGQNQDEVAIDSRLAWYWIPKSFKVFLDLDLEAAAKRILANMDPERIEHEHIPEDPHEYAQILNKRLKSEAKRYMNLYKVNPYETTNYDLVVDTYKYGLEEVVKEILENYNRWLEK